MPIRCCRFCEPPKRHIGCHGDCPEYAKESAKNNLDREARHMDSIIRDYRYGETDKNMRGLKRKRRKREAKHDS